MSKGQAVRTAALLAALILAGSPGESRATTGADRVQEGSSMNAAGGSATPMKGPVRVGYLHHSTGGIVWAGGLHPRAHRVWERWMPAPLKSLADRAPEALKSLAGDFWPAGVPDAVRRWNAEHGTDYRIEEQNYPSTSAGYPWANYPYDYWNLWVKHRGESRDRGELNLDDLARRYDVIVFKHCFPVSRMVEDAGTASVESEAKTRDNYELQYAALKKRMREFPDKRFLVWTGAALNERGSTPEQAQRARQFFTWVKEQWDEPGDNIFVWDFYELEADARGFLDPAKASKPGNSHPSGRFARVAAPLVARRIIDVIEGRGDTAHITGGAVASSQRGRPELAATADR